MSSLTPDIEDPANIRSLAARIATQFPAVNVLINNAGIMRVERLQAQPDDLADAEATIATNLLGPIRLTAALLPLLQKQPYSAIMNVSSRAGFCADGPHPHLLRNQGRHPLVHAIAALSASGVHDRGARTGPSLCGNRPFGRAADPRAMPLDQFIAEVMEILKTQPAVTEICVDKVKRLRFAAEGGHYDSVFRASTMP